MRILWIPHASWLTPQRAHDFCRELAQRHEVHVTDWVADFSSPADYLSRRYLRNFTYRRQRDGAITVHGVPRLSPALYVPLLRRLNAAIFSGYTRRIIARERIDVVVGTFVVPPPAAPRLILDQFDDNVALWLAQGRAPGYAEEIAAVEQLYLRRAQAVVAVGTVMAERTRRRGYEGPLSVIPNGVHVDRYSAKDGMRVREALALRGPVVGLVGNHGKWVEVERVLRVARMMAGTPATFLIVGRGAAGARAREVARREGLRNVRVVGFVPPQDVAAYFSAIDVGLCPYDKNEGSDAQCPLRLLSYSAAGSAVVCTELEEVKRMGFPNVMFADPRPESIARAVEMALARPRTRPDIIERYDIRRLAAAYERVLADTADGEDLADPRQWQVAV
ncbi:MAG: glycosyltransferase [Chloroflexota bacterium]